MTEFSPAEPRSGREGTRWEQVSVIVPTRWRPELLARALRSIVGQDYPGAVEILVVFDQEEPTQPSVPSVAGRTIRRLVDEEIPGGYGEDYEWLLRSSRRAPIIAVKDPLVRAHWHPKSFFSDRWPI